jgi:hypothetical protein
MPSFGLPHVADLRHVKEPCDYMEVGSQVKLSRPFLARSPSLANRGL